MEEEEEVVAEEEVEEEKELRVPEEGGVEEEEDEGAGVELKGKEMWGRERDEVELVLVVWGKVKVGGR